ncbi:MAG: hypothetical protein WCB15_31240 [Desulfobacterales bacterium]|jgi:hypothetical protein
MEAAQPESETCGVFILMMPKIANQKVKISFAVKIRDKSDIRLALVALVSAVKIKQTNFYAK